jgi:UPF0042 nucleotide-binding protein
VLFLEATDAVLVRRFEQVRRPHPLQGDGTLLDGITAERTRMAEIRAESDLVIDTSDLNIHQLATTITERFQAENAPGLRVTLMSFGYKHGLPTDADIVADCRFLPNPFYVEALRKKSGTVPATAEYIWKWPITQQFAEKLNGLLEFLVPNYIKEGKSQLVIALGCTGGMHRSVFMADKVGRHLKELGYNVTIEHRNVRNNDVEEHIE